MTIVSFMDKKVILTYLITYSSMTKMIASFDENWKIIFRSQSKLEIEKRYIQFSSHHIIMIFVEFVSYCDTDNILSHFCFFILYICACFSGPSRSPGTSHVILQSTERFFSMCIS